MKIFSKACYNLDVLCFLNVITGDEFYLKYHREAYEKFSSGLSVKVKRVLRETVEKRVAGSMLSPQVCLHISALTGFEERELVKMLKSQDEIVEAMQRTPYDCSREDMAHYETVMVPLIEELEAADFCEYWKDEHLPRLQERCAELNAYAAQYDLEVLINQFKNSESIDNSDFTNYIGAFARPLGTKLCGNNIISDVEWSNTIILSTVAHESFHPPYDHNKVDEYVEILSKKPWFSSVDFGNYATAKGFVEENIVEALGVYVSIQLGLDIDPVEYFKNHDRGSHVLSPYFYKYLCENEKNPAMPFEEYFIDFVKGLDV